MAFYDKNFPQIRRNEHFYSVNAGIFNRFILSIFRHFLNGSVKRGEPTPLMFRRIRYNGQTVYAPTVQRLVGHVKKAMVLDSPACAAKANSGRIILDEIRSLVCSMIVEAKKL